MRISDWSSDVCSSDLVAPAWVEHPLLDPARPDADVVIHPLVAQHLRETFGWSDQRIALAIELAQPGDDERFEERQIIIAKIGLEARVHRAGHRQPPPPRPRPTGRAPCRERVCQYV